MSQSPRKPAAPVKPIHVLLFCLGVVALIFAGSIALSVFYVQQNSVAQSPP